MRAFKSSPNYLLRYCVTTLALFITADTLLLLSRDLTAAWTVHPLDLTWTVLALLLCGLPSSILHNCAHGNVGGKRLNRAVGEVCGTIMLYGFEGFRLGHVFHHKYPDNPQYDPHPPHGLKFHEFLVSPIKATLDVIENAYYANFDHGIGSRRNVALQKIFFNLSIVARLVFWVALLGPKWFLLFYLPMYFANIFVFAHINFATHVQSHDGSFEIINLDSNSYYQFINLVSFGGYYHKNHHLSPKSFNPARVSVACQKSLVTYQIPATRSKWPSPVEKAQFE
jgi:fatty acid desaturase